MGKKAPRERFITAQDEFLAEASLSRSPTPQLIGKRKRSQSQEAKNNVPKKLKASVEASHEAKTEPKSSNNQDSIKCGCGRDFKR